MDATVLILPASLAGGVVGLLIFWNRRPRKEPLSYLRRTAVLVAGIVASAVSLLLFVMALGANSALFALTVTMLIAAWTALCLAVLPLRSPLAVVRVGNTELALLRRSWTGVPLFGMILRKTPLRHLGGPVYLAECCHDVASVLRGIQEAEDVHAWSVVFCFPFVVFWCSQGLWLSVSASLVVHALLNVYPILHLRFTRGRIERYAVKLAHHRSLKPETCQMIRINHPSYGREIEVHQGPRG